jgi:ankyrin repeat protein
MAESATKDWRSGNTKDYNHQYGVVEKGIMLHYLASSDTSPEKFQKYLDLHKGKDLNIMTKNGWTATALACLKGRKSNLKILLDAGADPSVCPFDGVPTIFAAAWKSTECFEFLMEQRPELANFIHQKTGGTIWHLVCQHGPPKSLYVLLQKRPLIPIDQKLANGRTALSNCIERGQKEMALQMLNAGAHLPLAAQGLKTLPLWVVEMALDMKDERIRCLESSGREKKRHKTDDE